MSSKSPRATPALTSPLAQARPSPTSRLLPLPSLRAQPSLCPGKCPAPPTSSSLPKSAPLAPLRLPSPLPPPPPTPSVPPTPSAKRPLPCPLPFTNLEVHRGSPRLCCRLKHRPGLLKLGPDGFGSHWGSSLRGSCNFLISIFAHTGRL